LFRVFFPAFPSFNFFFFSFVSSEQFPTIQDGLLQRTIFFEAHEYDFDLQSNPMSMELVKQFIKLLSSKGDEFCFLNIYKYISVYLNTLSNKMHQFFSLSLNHSLLRIMCCCDTVTTDIVVTYSSAISGLQVDQYRIVADSGAWLVLVTLFAHKNNDIASAAGKAIMRLVWDRKGEDYARFVEEDLFGQLMKHLPSPIADVARALITIVDKSPFPTCCSPVVIALNEQTKSDNPDHVLDALRFLTRIACCRGLIFYLFPFATCDTFSHLQQTTQCFSQPGVTLQQLHSLIIRSR
jgi:hypothetical protein